MGNWLALETLRQMAIRDRRIAAKVRNVLLAAPDVDIDLAREAFRDMGSQRPNLTLFVSQDKGNISRKGEKVFHVPGSRDYDRTRISEKDGERMFCTEDEARAAGWRAPW